MMEEGQWTTCSYGGPHRYRRSRKSGTTKCSHCGNVPSGDMTRWFSKVPTPEEEVELKLVISECLKTAVEALPGKSFRINIPFGVFPLMDKRPIPYSHALKSHGYRHSIGRHKKGYLTHRFRPLPEYDVVLNM